MVPKIFFIRHGQATHNVSLKGSLEDARLTVQGELQAVSFRSSFRHHAQIKRVISSPLQRALQTAILALARDDIGPIVALDTLQETGDAPSSTGVSLDKLQTRYGATVDISRVRAGWNEKGTDSVFEPEWNKLRARTREARRVIRELAGDGNVAVVAHGAVLHFLTEDWQGISGGIRRYT